MAAYEIVWSLENELERPLAAERPSSALIAINADVVTDARYEITRQYATSQE